MRYTENGRVNFGRIKLSAAYPDLLEIQIKSFKEFFQLYTTPENRINEGLYKVVKEIFSITDDRKVIEIFSTGLVIEILPFAFDKVRRVLIHLLDPRHDKFIAFFLQFFAA